jgi:Flp pilus assembly pilin Flp
MSRRHIQEELGQTTIEYALLLAFVVVTIFLAVTWSGLSGVIQTAMSTIAGAI